MVPLISTNGSVLNDENTFQYIREHSPCFTVIFVHRLSNSSPNYNIPTNGIFKMKVTAKQ